MNELIRALRNLPPNTKTTSISIKNDKAIINRDGSHEEIAIDDISRVNIVDDYTIINQVDLAIQSLFATSFIILVVSWTAFLSIFSKAAGKRTVISALLSDKFLMISIFVLGLALPSFFFLSYSGVIRKRLVDVFNPKYSIVSVTTDDGVEYSFENVPDDTAMSVFEEVDAEE